jgi:glycosyltransferase involved in cell wall biosynthesis
VTAPRRLRIAAVEPYFGGSHRHFLLDLQRHSTFTLPPRLWKWRVRGAALQLARAVNAAGPFDVLLCSDFVNLPDLRALLAPALRVAPVLYYLHENQLSYPLSPDETFDPYFGFTNVLSCLSAEAVAFNSEFHRREFLQHLPGILPRLPDYEPKWIVETITARAEVLPVGIAVAELEEGGRAAGASGTPRRILWNHRWEFDKRPERFFAALETLAARGVPFVADVVGESFARRPPVFDTARAALGARIDRFCCIESRADYVAALHTADVVVSTANQEFFGIAMAEAVVCGAHPVAPAGLVYADLYAGPCAALHLYRDDAELAALLEHLLTDPPGAHDCPIPDRYRAFDWRRVARRFDARFATLARDHAAK